MAQYQTQINNELIQFRRDITLEYFRFNQFSPYMGTGPTSIIQRFLEPQRGGKQINIPLVEQLKGKGRGKGTLVGNEESIDNYGCRLYIDPARNAITTDNDELQKESAKIFGRARELLGDWGVGLQRDEIIESLMALPWEQPPEFQGSDEGDRVNGRRYENATAAEKNAWNAANEDRVLYGNSTANYNAVHATALANVDPALEVDFLKGESLVLMKSLARRASPKIAPTRVSQAQNREFYMGFCGTTLFNQLAEDLKVVPNADARPRDVGANPLFQDGDLLYRGVIVREFPEIDEYTENVWTSLATAGAGGTQVRPFFLCGRSALGMPWGMMPRPTMRKEDDYGFIQGVGVEMCYGVGKLFKRSPQASTDLKQWGVVTGFFAS